MSTHAFMTIRSWQAMAPLAVCAMAVQPSLATDRYSGVRTEAENATAYGNSFREYGSTITPPSQPWGEETFHWEKWKGHASVKLSSIYDNNVILSSPNRQEDLIWTIAPSIDFGRGDYQTGTGNSIALQWDPSYVAFSDHTRYNSFDQNVRLGGRYELSKLSLALNQVFTDVDGALVEVGKRVRTRIYSTFLGANYAYTEKSSLTLNLNQMISDYNTLNHANDWTVELFNNWQATEKIRVSVGGAYGLRDLSHGPNENFQQAITRISYQWTEKLSFDGAVGCEFRQFQDAFSEGPSLIFSTGTTWTPRDEWTFTVEAHKRDQSSIATGGVNIGVTGISGIIRKQFLTRYFIGVSGSYDGATYRPIQSGLVANRTDKYWSVTPSLDCNLSDRWTLSVFYMYRDNRSTGLNGISFNNNQAGVRTTYRF